MGRVYAAMGSAIGSSRKIHFAFVVIALAAVLVLACQSPATATAPQPTPTRTIAPTPTARLVVTASSMRSVEEYNKLMSKIAPLTYTDWEYDGGPYWYQLPGSSKWRWCSAGYSDATPTASPTPQPSPTPRPEGTINSSDGHPRPRSATDFCTVSTNAE